MTEKCRLSVGSVTYAEKAKRALASAAVYSEMIKLDGDSRGKGCVYGLEVSCSQLENARSILRSAGIKAKEPSSGRGRNKT